MTVAGLGVVLFVASWIAWFFIVTSDTLVLGPGMSDGFGALAATALAVVSSAGIALIVLQNRA